MGAQINYGAMRALIALSNKQLAEFIWHFLRDRGVGVVHLVRTPEEAVSRMLEEDFNLFFVDYDLGRFGGVDFTKFIRLCNGPVAEAPVVMIIPNPDKDKVFAARDGGVNEILGLPLTVKLMETRLSHMLGSPKPFIRCPTYIGPCRRREVVRIYHGQDRRTRRAQSVGR